MCALRYDEEYNFSRWTSPVSFEYCLPIFNFVYHFLLRHRQLYEDGHAFSLWSANFYTQGGAGETPGAKYGKSLGEHAALRHTSHYFFRSSELR